MNYHFATVVWGESYTNMFLKDSLPSLLSPGNLPSFYNKSFTVYRIYTTPDDASKIRLSSVFLKLSEVISTELIFMEATDFAGLGHECYKKAINNAVKYNAAFIQLAPDMIWSDGTFFNLQKIVASGKKAILLSIYYVSKDTFEPEFIRRYYSENELTAKISSRDLVKLSLEHAHKNRALTHFWDASEFTLWPAFIFWSVGNEGILARRFHMHPIMLCPSKEFYGFLSSLDGSQYIPLTHPNYKDIYIVEDSDEMFSVELCDSTVLSHPSHPQKPGNKSNVFNVACWAIRYWNPYHCNTNSYHRKFLKYKIRMHYTDISRNWRKVEKASDRIINIISFLVCFLSLIKRFIKL